MALGALLELIPGDSKFGPELCCCYRIYIKKRKQQLRNSSMPFEVLCISTRDQAERDTTCTTQAALWPTDVTGLLGRTLQEGSEGGNELHVADPHPEVSSLLLLSLYRRLYLLLSVRCQVPRQTWAFLFSLYMMNCAVHIKRPAM